VLIVIGIVVVFLIIGVIARGNRPETRAARRRSELPMQPMSLADPKNPIGFTNPLSPNNKFGWTKPGGANDLNRPWR
jgi:hypothetical protein